MELKCLSVRKLMIKLYFSHTHTHTHTHTHSHTGIPRDEFPQPYDLVIESSDTITSGDTPVQFFQSSTFIMVGQIPVQFGECKSLS